MTIRSFLLSVLLPALMTATGCAEKKTSPSAIAPGVDISQAREIFSTPVTPAVDPETVIAVVNGEKITQAQINQEMMAFLSRLRGRVPPERIGQMRPQIEEQALNAAISKVLLREAVAAEKVEVSDLELEQAINHFRTNTAPGISLEELLARNNATMEEFRDQLANDLRVNKLLEKHVESVPDPSDETLRAYYDQHPEQFTKPESVRASHILVTVQPTDTPDQKSEKKAKAEQLRAKLLDGEDFAACASENSDCPSKAQGGDLGEFRRGMMVKPFEDAAFTQEVGAIGPIVETQFGYHIIKVTDHEQPGKVDFDEIKERLAEFLKGQERQKMAEAYVEGLRAKAQVTFPGASETGS